jgi:hypothetical protein
MMRTAARRCVCKPNAAIEELIAARMSCASLKLTAALYFSSSFLLGSREVLTSPVGSRPADRTSHLSLLHCRAV